MRSRCVGEESLGVEDKELVHAVRQNLVLHLALDASTSHDGVEVHTELVGEFAALGQKLL